tara:strand:+ start:1972 stop:2310 length:339 start_codon:yes stop_codon:yes gene_type:complete
MANVRSSKAKGRRLQNYVRDLLRSLFKNKLDEDDIKSQTMGMNGEDIVLSPAARKLFPYSIECKNVEKISIWKAIKQAESNTAKGTTPLLIITRNRTPTYVVENIEDWIKKI